jgi:hypothetical protein
MWPLLATCAVCVPLLQRNACHARYAVSLGGGHLRMTTLCLFVLARTDDDHALLVLAICGLPVAIVGHLRCVWLSACLSFSATQVVPCLLAVST